MDMLMEKRVRLVRFATKAPRAERETFSPPAPTILPESAPGVPVLLARIEAGREFRRLDKRVMGSARRIRFAKDPRSGEAFRALEAARAERRRVERDGGDRFALEAAAAREVEAHDAYLAAQLGL